MLGHGYGYGDDERDICGRVGLTGDGLDDGDLGDNGGWPDDGAFGKVIGVVVVLVILVLVLMVLVFVLVVLVVVFMLVIMIMVLILMLMILILMFAVLVLVVLVLMIFMLMVLVLVILVLVVFILLTILVVIEGIVNRDNLADIVISLAERIIGQAASSPRKALGEVLGLIESIIGETTDPARVRDIIAKATQGPLLGEETVGKVPGVVQSLPGGRQVVIECVVDAVLQGLSGERRKGKTFILLAVL